MDRLLGVLCRHFITIEVAERQPLYELTRRRGQLDNIDDVVVRTCLLMVDLPMDIPCYMDGAELVEAFASREPPLRERFRSIVVAEEARSRNSLAEIVADSHAAASVTPPPDRGRKKLLADDAVGDGASGISCADNAMRGVGYILRQIEGRRLAIVEPEATARALGTEIGRLLSADAGRFAGADMRRYREMIGRYDRENGIVLWRDAWEAISPLYPRVSPAAPSL